MPRSAALTAIAGLMASTAAAAEPMLCVNGGSTWCV
jgi:hypothetical protein